MRYCSTCIKCQAKKTNMKHKVSRPEGSTTLPGGARHPALVGRDPQVKSQPVPPRGAASGPGSLCSPRCVPLGGTPRLVRSADPKRQENGESLPASLPRSGYASPRSFRASERLAAAVRVRGSSPGVAAAAGKAGPRCLASPATRAAAAGPPGSLARGSRGAAGPASAQHLQAPEGRAHSPRSRARPAPPPGPRGPPPGDPLLQRRGPRASPRSPGSAPQGRAGHRPVNSGRGPGTRTPGAHVLAARLRHKSSRSGQAGGPCMAPRPTRAPRPAGHGAQSPRTLPARRSRGRERSAARRPARCHPPSPFSAGPQPPRTPRVAPAPCRSEPRPSARTGPRPLGRRPEPRTTLHPRSTLSPWGSFSAAPPTGLPRTRRGAGGADLKAEESARRRCACAPSCGEIFRASSSFP